jgi:hypothetical protein
MQRSPNENLKKVAERIQKCSSDCKKFYHNDMFNAVLEKENYVSIMVFKNQKQKQKIFYSEFVFFLISHILSA